MRRSLWSCLWLALSLVAAACAGLKQGGAIDSAAPAGGPGVVSDDLVDGGEPDTALASVGVASPPAGEVELEPVTCDPPGAIDEAAVDAYFEGLLPAFGRCYTEALETAPGVAGRYVVEVIFDAAQGQGRSGGYFFMETGFLVVGFEECLGDHLIGAAIETPPESRASCKLLLRFGGGPRD